MESSTLIDNSKRWTLSRKDFWSIYNPRKFMVIVLMHLSWLLQRDDGGRWVEIQRHINLSFEIEVTGQITGLLFSLLVFSFFWFIQYCTLYWSPIFKLFAFCLCLECLLIYWYFLVSNIVSLTGELVYFLSIWSYRFIATL